MGVDEAVGRCAKAFPLQQVIQDSGQVRPTHLGKTHKAKNWAGEGRYHVGEAP